MATTSSTTKAKQDLTKSKSLNRKPKAPTSVSSEDGSSEQKPEKPLPNYLKPTISSRPDPVKFLKKNNNSLEDNQKLLRRRSFDRPPSSLTSPSTSSSPQKSLNVSPSLPRDRPTVPREKPVTAQRSSSFHGSRGVPRGGTTVKSSHVVPKKSGLSSSSTSLKSKKEGSSNVTMMKVADKEIPLDAASLASAQEDDHQEEILKVESDVHVADHGIEEPKDEKVTQEVQVEDVQAHEENVSGGPTTVASSPVVEDCVVVVVAKEDEKEEEELINEGNTEEKLEETKEQENNQNNKGEEEEEVLEKKIDDEHTSPKKVDIDIKEVKSVKETPEEKEEEMKEVEKEEMKEEEKEKLKEEVKNEEVKEEVKDEEVKEEEKEKVKEEEKEKVKEEEVKKKEVVKGKKGSPSAYNDVIASKMQENPRKNKVLALAGAFQTVIDYETTAASK